MFQNKQRNYLVACLFLLIISDLGAISDSVFIKIHFLHGSKPKHAFRHIEGKWFGGILGGHAGLEYKPERIVNFVPVSRVHVFSKSKINSKFAVHDSTTFYAILSGRIDSVKSTIIQIKISSAQKERLDSLIRCYRTNTPYDYAFFGMRCGAAVTDLLCKIGVLKPANINYIWRHTFYPRKLRRCLERNAIKNNYTVIKTKGTIRRKWEKD